ncbi:MAG: metal-dependent hydrolase [DPANN group archaeon]|nr:metal-dependent hydrolase [DPANN group archaeon]
MRFMNHFLFSLLLSLAGLILFRPSWPLLYLFLGLVSGLLPDIDESRSFLGRKIRPVGWLLKHRGITHSALPVFFLGFGIWLVTKDFVFVYMVAVPYSGHLLLDSFTKAGIKPLLPFSRRSVHGPFRTGGLFDRMLQFFWLFIIAFLMVWAIQLFLP